MNLFSEFAKVGSDEQRMVWGYASTGDVDSQNDIVDQGALREAWGDYWGNVREMHKASAVGVVREHSFDDRGLYIGVYVGDDQAWHKVREGIYKGFSIGGRALARDTQDNRRITKLALREISLVDRGANENAKFSLFKFDHDEGNDSMAQNELKVKLDTSDLDAKLALANEQIEKIAAFDEKLAVANDLVEKLGATAEAAPDDTVLKLLADTEKSHSELLEKVAAMESSRAELLEKIDAARAETAEVVKRNEVLLERLEKVEAREVGVIPATGAASGTVDKDADGVDPISKLGDDATAEDIIKAIHLGGGRGIRG